MSRGRLLQPVGGPRRATLPRRPRYLAHSSSCCRPPRGGRRAALLMLRFGTPSTGSSMAEAFGRRRTRLLRRHPSLHALARPSCYRRAASAARALAGLGRVQTSRYARRTGRVGRRSRDVLATLRTRRAAADRREAGVGQRSSCFSSARSLRARQWPRRSGGAARLLRRHPSP